MLAQHGQRPSHPDGLTLTATPLLTNENPKSVAKRLYGACARVSAALSHSASFAPHSNLIRAIESAMQEAVTADSRLCYPPLETHQGRPLQAHTQLASLEEEECI